MTDKINLFINELIKIVNPAEYELFFKNSKFDFSKACDSSDFEGKPIITIFCPQIWVKENISNKFLDIIKILYKQIFGVDVWVEFIINNSFANDIPLKLEQVPTPKIQPVLDNENNFLLFKENNFNSKYTFENFVVGDSNQFARAAAWAVATNPGKQFNPLFIYGGPGLGKTHLMQAIGHYARINFAKLNVLYITSEEFTNKFISALSQRKPQVFRESFNQVHLLLIDDIQFLVGKEQTQEVFFHTFNSLHNSGHQLVISSDKPPKELSTFEERLRTRMEWGLQADIQPPRFETRLAILKQLNENIKSNIGNDALEFIATHFKSDIREIEGAFNKLFAYSSIYNEVNVNACKTIFKDIIAEEHIPKNIPISKIVVAVGKHLNIEFDVIMSNKRDQPIAYARQLSMYCCKEISDYPYKYIGNFFSKDHSTVIHACKKIQELIDSDHNLLELVNSIKKNILNERSPE